MDTQTKRPRLEALTGLRYVAALVVLFYHLSANFPAGPFKNAVSELAGIPMQLFFTLSGFLLAYNYSAGFASAYGSTVRKYYLTRFARIYPIYFIALILWLGLVGHLTHDLKEHPRDTCVSLAMTATMTQNWAYVPLYEGTSEPRLASFAHMWIGWTVSVECFFYLILPLIAIPLTRYVTSVRRAWIVGGVIYVFYLAVDFVLAKTAPPSTAAQFLTWQFLWNPYIRLGEFLVGVLAGQAFLHSANRPLSRRGWWSGTAVLVAGVAALFYANHWIWSPGNKSAVLKAAAGNVLYAPLCAAIIYSLAKVPSLVTRFLSTKPMVLLGEMTYCLYLIHPLVQVAFASRLKGLEDPPDAATLIFNHIVVLFFLHFLCLGLYRYGELPLRALFRRIFEGRREDKAAASKQEPPQLRVAA